eukprot:TRINITY_DN6115_c0_g2_i1.p1 TRINITY_DN6115_c0_g2~~TRINITY_DN6115_c0_g2_i1.p1  ORF type:complete len:561 (+),score=88.89 TRINITY_DN6115_c0_g2_i1:118-1683(+)
MAGRENPQDQQLEEALTALDREVADVRKIMAEMAEHQLLVQHVVTELDRRLDENLQEGKHEKHNERVGRISTTIKLSTEDVERIAELKAIILSADMQTELKREDTMQRQQSGAALYYAKKATGPKGRYIIGETYMNFVIIVNAVYMGVSEEFSDGSVGWVVMDSLFSAIFFFELAVNLTKHRLRHFTGPGGGSNTLDAFLVMIDAVQIIMLLIFGADPESAGVKASLFRVIRLARLTRILRVIRLEVFRDLVAMILGMLGGLHTLTWALLLYITIVYVFTLIFRELLRNSSVEAVAANFNSVPRAMFTVYRCSFGDCSAADGSPIFEHVVDTEPFYVAVGYCMFMFLVAIGLFNVISAIFVEETMRVAATMEGDDKTERWRDYDLFSRSMVAVIGKLLAGVGKTIPPAEEVSKEFLETAVSRDAMNDLINDEEMCKALANLDVQQADFYKLSDLLDPDNNGTITVAEFLDGVKMLRGDLRRSDTVNVDLMVRTMQEVAQTVERDISRVFKHAVAKLKIERE